MMSSMVIAPRLFAKRDTDSYGSESEAAFRDDLRRIKAPLDGGALSITEALCRVTQESAMVHIFAQKTLSDIELTVNGRRQSRASFLGQQRLREHINLELKNLEPGSRNSYQICYRSNRKWYELPERTFRTQREKGVRFSFSIIADSHIFDTRKYLGNREGVNTATDLILNSDDEFVIFAGDETGVTSAYEFERMGLDNDSPPKISRKLWHFWRRTYPGLTHSFPTYFCLGNHDGETGWAHHMRPIATVNRKRYFPMPTHETYAEGGENEDFGGEKFSRYGNCSPLENYYAFSWGDVLFIVLDVCRYSASEAHTRPAKPEDWTLGEGQLNWLRSVLSSTKKKQKFIIAHHVVGGWKYNPSGGLKEGSGKPLAYGRGGAVYARIGEQAKIHDLMIEHKVKAFIYGHDHVFSVQETDGIYYICCGKPTEKQAHWMNSNAWATAYPPGLGTPNVIETVYESGFTRITLKGRSKIKVEYIRTLIDEENGSSTGLIGETISSITL